MFAHENEPQKILVCVAEYTGEILFNNSYKYYNKKHELVNAVFLQAIYFLLLRTFNNKYNGAQY